MEKRVPGAMTVMLLSKLLESPLQPGKRVFLVTGAWTAKSKMDDSISGMIDKLTRSCLHLPLAFELAVGRQLNMICMCTV